MVKFKNYKFRVNAETIEIIVYESITSNNNVIVVASFLKDEEDTAMKVLNLLNDAFDHGYVKGIKMVADKFAAFIGVGE